MMKTITILLIEDNTQDIRLIKEMLKEIRSFNYDLVLAATLKDGCKQIQKNNFDIILLDLNLPDSTGQQTFQKVIDCCKEIPVVLITGNEDQELSVKLIMEGAQDYITKQSLNPAPLEKSILYSIERQVLLRNIKIQKAEITRIEKELILTAKFPAQNPGPVLRIDEKGKLLYINESGIKLLPDWQLIINEIIPSRLKDIIDPIFDGGTNIEFELDHRELIYSFYAVPIIEDGYINLYGRDITERKQAEEALRETNDKLIRAQRVAHIGSWETELLNLKVVWSEETYRIFEIEPDSFKSSQAGFWEFVHPEDRAKVDAAFEGSIGKHSFNSIEHRIITPSGIVKFVEECWEVIYDNQGLLVRIMGTCQDITERKQAEKVLAIKEERYRELFDNISSGVAVYEVRDNGEDFIFVDFNKAGEMLDGDRLEDLIGKSVYEKRPGIKEYGLTEVFKRVWKTGTAEYFPPKLYIHFNKWYENFVYRLPTGEIVALYNDVTEGKLAEEAFRESQEMLHKARKLAQLGVWDWKADGDIVIWTEELYQIAGLDPKLPALTYAEHSSIYSPQSWNLLKTAVEKALKTGEPYELELELIRSDGVIRNVITFGGAKFDNNGQVNGLYGTVQDITERKQAEQAIRESQSLYLSFIEQLPNAVFRKDMEGRYILFNSEFCKLKGLAKEDILGKKPMEVSTDQLSDPGEMKMASKFAKLGEDLHEQILQTGKSFETEEEYPAADGSKLTLQVLRMPVVDSNGTIIGSQGIMFDITERKKAEEAFRESDEILNQFMANSPELVFIKDEKHRFKKLSKNFEVMFGKPINELIGKDLYALIPEDLAKNVFVDDQKVLQRGVIVKAEERVGDKFYSSVKFPIHRKAGLPDYLAGYSIDITERKQKEQELGKALVKATESDRLKSAFLAAMSHELRTPLNAIIGFSGFLDRNLPGDDVVEFGEIINSSGNHLLSIVNDIFDITLIESGQTKIIKEKINLNSMLYDVHNMAGAEKQRINKNAIELRLILPSEEEDIIIYTDPYKLKQILINLLKNALKFTEKGHIHYGYSLESEEGKPVLRFYVKDTGIGIPENKKEVIFDMFRQVDESLSRKYGGTGIGLSISKKLAGLLGGKIWVESEIGEGSTFYFTIPFETHEEVSKPVKKEIARKNRLKGKTILIVEDDEPSFKLLKIILEGSGVYTLWAKNGQEAIKCCKENTGIDLVLMDMNMPVMNGYDATREIKKFRPGLPIIAQTAHAIAGDREKALAADCDDYISKPIKKDKLVGLIVKHLSRPIPG